MNLVTLATDWDAGRLKLQDAVNKATQLKFPKKERDTDGEVWFDGDESNTTAAVYAVLPVAKANEFLKAVSEKLNGL